MNCFTKNSIATIVKACLLTIVIAGFLGCSEKIEPQPLTYTQLLTGKESKTWQLTTVQVLDNGNPPQTISASQAFGSCGADDLYIFYANEEKKFETQEGASKCNANDPDVFVEGSWSMVNASATLEFPFPILTGSSAPFPLTVKQLTETNLTLEYYFPDINASYRFIFTAQRGG